MGSHETVDFATSSSKNFGALVQYPTTAGAVLIAATFEVEVTVLANVIAFKPLPPPNKPRLKASR